MSITPSLFLIGSTEFAAYLGTPILTGIRGIVERPVGFPMEVVRHTADPVIPKVAVVIPIADYEEMMEDVADLAAVAERRDEPRISFADVKKQLVADGLLSD